MKVGIILVVLQIIAFVEPILKGERIFYGSLPSILGSCFLGIIGVILIIRSITKKNKLK